jgi:hypothetical protein
MEGGASPCWCMARPLASGIPARYVDCLCAECLSEYETRPLATEPVAVTEAVAETVAVTAAESATASASELIEGVDYYLENGLFVFTAKYLLGRGYCCNSGCRHCPYKDQPPGK